MRFPDVMFDVCYRAKTGVRGECSDFNGRKMFPRSSCFQDVPYNECNSAYGFLHTRGVQFRECLSPLRGDKGK